MANIQASKINDAWNKAMASYKRELNEKQLQTVEALTAPEDIVAHMTQLEKRHASSSSGKLTDRVKSVTDRLVRFSKVIDTMTTSNAEASLIWGSLKLLLTIVHQSSEVYRKICQSLITVGESLPVVGLLAETFAHSDLVSDCIVRYYCSILRFWRKALKHYRRKKIINLFRGAWYDYNSEFGNFENDMKRLCEESQKAAHAVDMNEAKEAREQQKLSSHESRNAEESKRHREIVEWLSPSARDARYYVEDFKSADKDRHPGTCEWVLRKPEFQRWLDSDGADSLVRILWIFAIAGAGKTVLSAFIIGYCQAFFKAPTTKSVLYFFFKNTDDEKSSLLSMTRSFLHQLYVLLRTDELSDDLASLKDDSGKDRMLSDGWAWDMFRKYAGKAPGLILVLDALDECKDIDELLSRICMLARDFDVRVVMTSRREENIHVHLKEYPCIQIQPEDIHADIECFAMEKIHKLTRLNFGSLQQRIVDTLTSRHKGMFLWVFLMIKELECLGTVEAVEKQLLAVPSGLEELHRAIILRLSHTLSPSGRIIAPKVLSWVVSAIRPLSLAEIYEILRFEIKHSSDKDDLLYSENDIELICGSLVTTRNGVLQLIHLSTKDILQQRPKLMHQNDPCWSFYVDVRKAGPRIATLCISYTVAHQKNVDSYTRPDLSSVSRLELLKKNFDINGIVKKNPFIEYAYTSWQAHLIDGDLKECDLHELQSLLTFRFTMLWLEFRLAQNPDSLWKLEVSCVAMRDWISAASEIKDTESERVLFLQAWCEAMLELLKDYGFVIRRFPDELHCLDIGPLFSSHGLVEYLPEIEKEKEQVKGQVRERQVHMPASENPKPKLEIEPYRVLPGDTDYGLGFFLYDEKRDVFYCGGHGMDDVMETLWVQDRQTGRRLNPARSSMQMDYSDMSTDVSAVLSRDRRYLGVVHLNLRRHTFHTSIWEIEENLNFRDIKQSEPWARRLQFLSTGWQPWCDWFRNSCCPLTIGPNDLFCAPDGLVDPHRGVQQHLPVSLSLVMDTDAGQRFSLAYSGDGEILFKLDSKNRKIEKIFWMKPKPSVEKLDLSPVVQSSSETGIILHAINHDGTLIVFGTIRTDDPKNLSRRAYLMNTGKCTANMLLLFEETGRSYRDCFFVFWNTSLILISKYINKARSEAFDDTNENNLFVYRWDNVLQDSFDHGKTNISLQMPLNKRIHNSRLGVHLQIIDRSTKAFLTVGDRILNEIDLRDLTINAPGAVESDAREFGFHRQVSTDGHHLGCVYRIDDESDPNTEEVVVQITDLTLSENSPRYMKLIEPKSNPPDQSTFSADLSMLYTAQGIYDLSSANTDMTTTRLYCPNWDSWDLSAFGIARDKVLFSSCNRFVFLLLSNDFKIFKICRLTKTLIELHVRGRVSSPSYDLRGEFHPNLPIFLLGGGIRYDENRQFHQYQAVEIDLSTLETAKLPLPTSFLSEFHSLLTGPGFLFSESGRHAWGFFRGGGGYNWYQIPKVYPLKAENLNHRVPTLWHGKMLFDQKVFEIEVPDRCHVVLHLKRQLNDKKWFVVRPSYLGPHVRITSVPPFVDPDNVYLLPGHGEEDPVRVLFVPLKGENAVIKFLPVTMKEILAKLNELAENYEES